MGFLNKLRNSFRPDSISQDAAEELAWHREQRMEEFRRAGMTAQQARAAATQRLGSAARLREETAEADLLVWVDALHRDLVRAIRLLRRTPTVTLVAIASLALGIGANTMVFSLMKQVVLDHLPVPEPEQLTILHSQSPDMGHVWGNGMHSSFSVPLAQDLDRATKRIFDGVLAFRGTSVSLSGKGAATETVSGALVSGNFFDVLRVKPWRGRLLTLSDDGQPGEHPVAVIGYGLWQREFAGSDSALNRTILINKHPYAIVGVTPPSFYGTDVSSRTELFVPIAMTADIMADERPITHRLDHWVSLMARRKPGITETAATRALSVIYPPLRDQDLAWMKTPSPKFLADFARKQILLTSGGKGYAELRDDLGNPLKMLMAMVALVLLITIVNVANLLIARGLARRREMAIRLSIGAGRGAIMRQLLIESVVLALLGGIAGVGLAFLGTPPLLHALSFDLSQSGLSAAPDFGVLVFSAALSMGAGILFGLFPAWQGSRADVGMALKSESGHGSTGRTGWLRRALVAGQIALSLILLCAAILFVRSLQKIKQIDAGFETSGLVRFHINPAQAAYTTERAKTFGEELRRRLAGLPGVESVAIATVPVLEDTDEGGGVAVEGVNFQDDDSNGYNGNLVSPAFFETLRIPLLAGRVFTTADSLPTSKVAVVNQTFVKRFLPGRNPVGVRFGFGSGNKVNFNYTIVGVVADSKHTALRSKIGPFVYRPYLAGQDLSSLTFYLRVRRAEQSLMPAIRELVHQADADLPVNKLATLHSVIDEALFIERSLGFLSMGFALLATLLSAVGLYGVTAYSVERRCGEVGIRMALGATPSRVLKMILREAAAVGLVGVLIGLPLAVLSIHSVESALYGMKARDPLVWLSAALFLLIVALASGLAPAWRAARIDPHEALRSG